MVLVSLVSAFVLGIMKSFRMIVLREMMNTMVEWVSEQSSHLLQDIQILQDFGSVGVARFSTGD